MSVCRLAGFGAWLETLAHAANACVQAFTQKRMTESTKLR
jgi:hypothetical protein